MRDQVAEVLLGSVAVGTMGLAVRALWRRRWVASARRSALEERNRNRFGELRTEMFRMAREDAARLKSSHFATLYACLTTLMRHPRAYPAVVRFILRLPQSAPSRSMGPVSPREAALYLELASRLDLLCREFDRTYSLFAWMADRLPRRQPAALWVTSARVRAGSLESARGVAQARAVLARLGNSTGLEPSRA